MPIYGFTCQACQHSFDRLQKISDADPTVCPQCGKSQLARQVSGASIRLAGTGWYETDFKSEKEGRKNLAERPAISSKND
jgi:putative FmdB family regulatory protein